VILSGNTGLIVFVILIMKKAPALFLALLSLSLFSFAQSNDPNLGIIPAPKSVQINQGHFKFSNESGILFETAEDQKIAQLFHDLLKDKYSLNIPVAKNFIKAPKGVIRFSSAEYKGTNPEGYNLTVTPGQVDVAGKNAGLFYAFETLVQLLPVEKEANIQIPCATIIDEPRYKYRGLHLDVCRHIFPVAFIKEYIDLIALYKLNTFHWHLTDDQGWRIEIKKYPKLTQIGGFRAQTIIGNNNERMPQWFDNTPYGGFYTQDQIKEVVAYAASKFIAVIPEIELPGHSLAALSAYPELGCGDTPGPYKSAEKWGVFDDVYCAGKEGTFTFLEDVLSEVIELFPSSYIHIGGDECPKTKWKTCPYCQKRIKDNKLKDEHELQSYFIQRMEKFVNSKGRQIIGWDEILEGGLAPNATVMSWRGTDGGIAAAKQNHNVIMTPQNFVYLDHAQGKTNQEPLSIGGYTSLQETYSYDPTPSILTADQQKHIVGVQANIWTEYIETPEKVEYMLLPRLLALSEIAWTPAQQKNYTDFSEIRVPRHLAKLDKTSAVYRVPVAIGAKDSTLLGPEFNIDLKSSVESAKIYYTINGYTPGQTDNAYDKPIKVTVPPDEKRLLKTVVITPSGKRSAVTTTVLSNMLPLAPVTTGGQVPGLKYYFIPGDYELTAQLDTARASDKGVSTIISLVKFRSKVRTYGLVFDGYINIVEDGVTTFTTTSGDGSQIWIDDQLIVDNDQKHASFEQTGAVNLLKGQHRIKIKYFKAGGSGDFRTYMSQGGKARTDISPGLLFN
jgi:hexosaminidase